MNTVTQSFSGLNCHVVDALPPGSSPTRLVVLCHGFGAPGDDLVSLAFHLLDCDDRISGTARFVFPEAPIDLTNAGIPGGRAWWPINMAKLAEINQTREYEQLTTLEPPGMSAASEQLAGAVREMQSACGLDDSSTILGGFSQGAMVTTNLVLMHGFVPQLLNIFSGTLLWRDTWTAAAAEHPGCRVIQSHGRQDMVLPFPPAESLRDMLQSNGFQVTFCPFDGPHTIHPSSLSELLSVLAAPAA